MRYTSTLTLMTMGLLLAACSGSDGSADPEGLDAQLSTSFGGLTTDDGLDVDLDLGEESDLVGEEADEPLADEANGAIADAENGDMDEAQRPEVYVVTLLWGRTFDPEVQTSTVWNPTIQTDCGRLLVRRRVRLEPGEGVVRPRIDLTTLEVRSRTRPHHDGLSFVVHVPRGIDCGEDGPMLTFESAPIPTDDGEVVYSASAKLKDLTQEALFQELPNDQFIAGVAEKVEPENPRCRKGRAIGYWAVVPESNGGIFHGRVINRYDQPIGRIGGVWGVPDEGDFAGQEVFFGKIVAGPAGRFDGLIAGTYTASSTTAPVAGTLDGAWHVVADYRQFIGGFTGTYAGAESVDGAGMFLGEYASEACDSAPPAENLED